MSSSLLFYSFGNYIKLDNAYYNVVESDVLLSKKFNLKQKLFMTLKICIGIFIGTIVTIVLRIIYYFITALLSPILLFIGTVFLIFLYLLIMIIIILKLLFPNIPIRKFINKKTIIFLLSASLFMGLIDFFLLKNIRYHFLIIFILGLIVMIMALLIIILDKKNLIINSRKINRYGDY